VFPQALALVRPLGVFAIAFAVFLILRSIVRSRLRRKVPGRLPYAMMFADTVRLPSLLWCLAAAIAVALQVVNLTPRQEQLAQKWIVIFLIVSFTLAAASLAVRAIGLYGERQRMPFAVAGLSRTLTRVVILCLGALILMRYLGLAVEPLIATLGIGGLAVALALQDTLANFFAGVHILVETPLSVGDYIRLSSEEEGQVTDIGWRTTRVQTPGNNVIVIPNTKITSGTLLNYSLPDRRLVADIPILVGHDADPEKVSRLAMESAAGVEGVLTDPPPVVFCDPGITPTHLQMKLLFHIENRLGQGKIKSDVRLRMLKKFRDHGIPLPEAVIAERRA
jgi:small-conductance mechanosensitive channel